MQPQPSKAGAWLLGPLLAIIPLLPATSPAQSRITYNGLPLFMNGSNIAWINFSADLGPGATNFERFALFFDSVKANGGNSMRFWMHTNGSTSPAYGSDGRVTGPGVNTISDLGQILDLAWERRIGLLLSLWSFDMTGTSYGTDLANRNRMLLTDSAARAAYLQNCLVPMVQALAGHPGIIAWEIFNEAEGMSDEFGWGGYLHVPMRDIQIFVNQAAGIIHRIDPAAKVTTGAEGFYALSDVNSLAKAVPLQERISGLSAEEKRRIEIAFAARYGFSRPVETILSRTEVSANYNYYRDDRLLAAGGDPDGTLDFYTVHYYEWAGTSASPLHHPFDHWGLTKPLILAEFYAQPTLGLATEDLYRILIDNGYAGAFTWQWINAGQQAATKPLLRDLRARYPADIIVDQVPGEIFRFEASDTVVEIGQPCTISWSAAQGSLVTFNGVQVANQADTIVTPTVPTEYLLQTTGAVNGSRTISVNTVVADVDDANGALPDACALGQNYPNPFNPATTISYQIPERAYVRLSVYDVIGREVALLVDGEMPAGAYSLRWDAAAMPAGVYYYRMRAGDFSESKKLLLMR